MIDFGAVRAPSQGQTVTYTQIFSEGYAPIEQFAGTQQGPYSDIYALGATLYRAIGGQTVDSFTRHQATLRGKRDPQVPAAQVGAGRYSPDLLRMIDAALTVEPDGRPHSVRALLSMVAEDTVATPRREPQQRPPQPVAPDLSDDTITRPQAPGEQPTLGPEIEAASSQTVISDPRPMRRKLLLELVAALVMAAATIGSGAWVVMRSDPTAGQRQTGQSLSVAVPATVAPLQAALSPSATRGSGTVLPTANDTSRHNAENKAGARRSGQAPLQDCDRLAQPPRGEMGTTPAYAYGVAFSKIDVSAAEPACAAAMRQYPNDFRFAVYAGRVAQKAGAYEDAVRLYKLAADQGDASGQTGLGYMYRNGLGGLEKDDREAVRLYKLAADQGDALARSNLGLMYNLGLGGLSRDDREAVRLFKLAVDQGNAEGQNNLGFMYLLREGGLAQDEREAVRLYKLAADQGNAEGQNNLGFMYEYGLGGLSQDDREAVRLYKLAADQGNAKAKASLERLKQN